MQLNLTWDRMQRHGKRNGWSADETRRRALGAVKTQFETAYKKIKTIYEKKKAKRDQRNGHGIDPDGLFGPQSDPCDGKGPLCGGGAL